MKKIIALTILILLSVSGYSQYKAVYSVATDSTAFGIAIPKNTLVFDYGANKLYRIDTLGNASSTILSLGLDEISASSTVSDLTIPVTNVFYVDGARTDSYTEDGSINRPYKKIQTCMQRINTLSAALALAGNYPASKYIVKITPGTYSDSIIINNQKYLRFEMAGVLISGKIDIITTQQTGDYYSKIEFWGGMSPYAEKGDCGELSGIVTCTRNNDALIYLSFTGMEVSNDLLFRTNGTWVVLADKTYFSGGSKYISGDFTGAGNPCVLLVTQGQTAIDAHISDYADSTTTVALYDCMNTEFDRINTSMAYGGIIRNCTFTAPVTIKSGTYKIDNVSYKEINAQADTLVGATISYMDSYNGGNVDVVGILDVDTIITMNNSFLLYQNEPLGNVLLGRGAGDVMIYDTISHYFNTAVGINALNANKGDQNTAIGLNAGMQNRGSNNIFIGYRAANYDTSSSNLLVINSIDRDSLTREKTHSIIYGYQNVYDSLQVLDLNANINVSHVLDAHKYINTDSSYYIKGIEFIKANHNLGNQFIGVGSGANNIVDSINNPPYGYLGSLNTANGYYSLYNNTMGLANVSNGAYSLYSNTTGYFNIANGYQSLYSNTTGSSNIANGVQSLYSNTTGKNNIANGVQSLYSNTTGKNNIANGHQSLYSNTTGKNNTAIGYKSLYSNTTGDENIAIGNNSGNHADTAAIGLLWIGEGDYNNAIIYGNMLTDSLRINANVNVGTNLMVNQSATIGTNLTVHSKIINGGLINKDTVLILADEETFEFPKISVGWAEIQCDSSLIEKTWGVVSWNGDGSTSLRSNGAKFVNTDIDGNYACFYDGGLYAILKNTSGYTQTYSIKYHYHY